MKKKDKQPSEMVAEFSANFLAGYAWVRRVLDGVGEAFARGKKP